MQRLAGDELEAVAGPDLACPRQRIVPLLPQRLRVQLRFALPRREAAIGKRPPIVRVAQPHVALVPQPFVRDPFEP